ncbi:MAG: hypothetical protein IAE82_00875 [Opitutaceae bacterium]|nr:hypothetical protein [Opitutaceae bacterium]
MTDQPDNNPPVPFRLPPLDGESIVARTRMTHLVLRGCGHLWPCRLKPWSSDTNSELDRLHKVSCPACHALTRSEADPFPPEAVWTQSLGIDAATLYLLSWADTDQAQRQQLTYCNPPLLCDGCSRSLAQARVFVDGVHRECGLAAYLCPSCFLHLGRGLGDGLGQLFVRRDGGSWLQVAGFSASEPVLTLEDVMFLFRD